MVTIHAAIIGGMSGQRIKKTLAGLNTDVTLFALCSVTPSCLEIGMTYDDAILLEHIEDKLDPESAAEIDRALADATPESAFAKHYSKLVSYQAARSVKGYALSLCNRYKSGSPGDDADDLVMGVFENLSRQCDRPKVHTLHFEPDKVVVLNADQEPVLPNTVQAIQCKLQVIELQNVADAAVMVEIQDLHDELRLSPAPSEAVKLAHRFLKVREHAIAVTGSAVDSAPSQIKIRPLKHLASTAARNLASDRYLKKLTPKERDQAAAIDDKGTKPRYGSKSKAFVSIDLSAEFDEGEVSGESILHHEHMDQMRHEATDQLEMREEGAEVFHFLQSGKMNPDFREALILWLNGEGYREIARQQNVSEGAARTRVCKARMALSKAFPETHERLKRQRGRTPRAPGTGDSDEN